MCTWQNEPLAGDVVLARHPEEEDKTIVKRIIAKGGTRLCVPMPLDPGHGVHVDHIADVPEGHVWLAGDNMTYSYDSRDYGPVPYKLLMGRVVFTVCCPQAWVSCVFRQDAC